MNKKGLTGIAVFLSILILGVVAAVLVLVSFPVSNEYEYLVTIPPGTHHDVPAGIRSFEIACQGRGGREGELSDLIWSDPDGHVIPEYDFFANHSIWTRSGNGSVRLIFQKPVPQWSGDYKCLPRFSYKDLQITVNINFYDQGKRPRFQTDYEIVSTMVGTDLLNVTCTATGDEPIWYEWYNSEHRQITTSSWEGKFTSLDGKTLHIEDVKTADSGLYNCVAENAVTRSVKRFEIVVFDAGKPRFEQEFEDVIGYQDSQTELHCRAISSLPITYKWIYPTKEIETNENPSLISEWSSDGESTLTIQSMQSTDVGIYYCQAQNDHGTQYKNFSVSFSTDGSPKFDKQYETVTISPGTNFGLRCEPSGARPMTFTWYDQDERISADSYFVHITSTSTGSVLKVEQALVHHAGDYTCSAKNQWGLSSKIYKVYVQDLPGEVQQIIFEKVTPTSITFQFLDPYNAGGLNVTHYQMLYRPLNHTDETLKKIKWTKGTPYILNNLTPRERYDFSVSAENTYGLGPLHTEFYTMPEENRPEPPTLIPETEFVSEQPDSIEVSWEAPDDNGKPITEYHLRYYQVIPSEDDRPRNGETEYITTAATFSYKLTRLEPNSYYRIEVKARNELGESSPAWVIIRTAAALVGPPRFSNASENVTALEHSTFDLLCCADNDDGATNYTWYDQHGESVASDQDSTVYASSTLKGSVLTLNPVSVNHSGVYECRAQNEHGLANMTFDIAVSQVLESIPKFEKEMEHTLVEVNSKLSLRCHALGEAPMTYEWYNQHQEIISSDEEQPVYASADGDASVLVIKKVERSHSGTYNCKAKNQFGFYSKIFDVTVYSLNENYTDDSSIRHVHVRNVTKNSVLFAIATKGDEDAIEGKYTEKRDSKEYTITFKKGEAYEVSGLVPGGLYSFRFRTVPSTDGSWSDEYSVILLPDKPEVVIRNAQPQRLEIEWFRSMDTIMRGTLIKYEISYYTVQIRRGNYWEPSKCAVTITLPSCSGARYTITALSSQVYYELAVRAFTESGPGEPYKHKFYMN